MNLRKVKLVFGFFVLLAYMSLGVLGLFKFSHMPERPMANCPYAENGFSVCDNNLDHINNWRQFINVVFTSFFSFLFFGLVLYFSGKPGFFNYKCRLFYKWRYCLDNKKLYSCRKKIMKWLSLFENSPSLSF